MITYLAVPYTHTDPVIRQARCDAINKYAAELMRKGIIVFSPISHGHEISRQHQLPYEFNYWRETCETFLRNCHAMHVLCMPGWRESTGVQHEINFAKSMGIQIEYIFKRGYT